MDVDEVALETPVSLPEDLSLKQQAAALALVSCSSFADAAKWCGVSERSLSRWMREEQFARAVQEMRREMAQFTLNTLARSRGKAVKALTKTLDNERHPGAQVAAARAVLKFTQDAVTAGDGNLRLARVEALLEKLILALADGTPPASLTVLLAPMRLSPPVLSVEGPAALPEAAGEGDEIV